MAGGTQTLNKQFWSERIREQTPYTAGEQPNVRGLIKLNTNENPYPPSKFEGALRSLRRYPDPNCTELTQTISGVYGVRENQIFIGNGSDEVLAMAYMAFFDGKLYAPDVTYSFYPVWAKFFGAEYHTIELNADFSVPADKFCGLDGGVIIANPNAPTGILLNIKDVERIVASNPEHVVIIDEAYIDFAGGLTALSLIDKYPNLLVVRTMSKSYSLAGIRVGYAMGDANLISALNVVKDSFNSYTVDSAAQTFAKSGLKDTGYFNLTRAKVIEVRERTKVQLRELGFTVTDSQANFLFASPPNGITAADVFAELRERRILVRHWNLPRIDNYLRITVGTKREMKKLTDALRTIII
jgi:histidinol-phosphate aminotransferase